LFQFLPISLLSPTRTISTASSSDTTSKPEFIIPINVKVSMVFKPMPPSCVVHCFFRFAFFCYKALGRLSFYSFGLPFPHLSFGKETSINVNKPLFFLLVFCILKNSLKEIFIAKTNNAQNASFSEYYE